MNIDIIRESNIKKNSRFLIALENAASDLEVKKVIQIGAGIGDGPTYNLLRPLQRKLGVALILIELSKRNFEILSNQYASFPFVTCVNGTTVAAASYKTHLQVKSFYWDNDTDFRTRLLDEVYQDRLDELNYLTVRGFTSGVLAGYVSGADLVLINGSEFTSVSEYTLAIEVSPLYFALWDTKSIKNYTNFQTLTSNTDYEKRASGVEMDGTEWAIFKLKDEE